ncbi:MAG TPA: tetratricopeptide repeat protein [Candidatus Hydrogenedentes bacterium]|nr:tetratricopeptide repeat protein [Candidatus Hydrogenedentota bacterium]HOH50815.1 tetratricopeptide repeat protein [Candidatus Hydrogenedentota bacterium]HRZ81310.1 tetratricopeptide repeat protein [Candidatus Hydrogenedentota bacterium]
MMNLAAAAVMLFAAPGILEDFSAAKDAYRQGNHALAAERFAAVAGARPGNAAVFYNLGNALFQAGELGEAVACYERALRLDPDLEAARINLEKVLERTQRNLARPLPADWRQALFFWAEGFRPATVTGLALFLWWALLTLLTAAQIRRIPYWKTLSGVCAALLALTAGAAWSKAHPVPLAVAAETEVPVYFSRSTEDTPRFMLYEGDRVVVERTAQNWALVSTVGGERGWLARSAIVPVDAPAAFLRGDSAPAAGTAEQAP